jgi:DNA-binding transcriptional MocR family regulator
VLWETLVGRKLFDGRTDYETFVKLRDCVVQPLRPVRPDVPSQFTQIIQRALAAQPGQRFPSAREMARQIGTALKKVQLRRDLHTVLSRSVVEARAGMNLAGRTSDPTTTTPIADLMPEDLTPPPGIEFPPKPVEEKRGLRHRLPNIFGLIKRSLE